MVEFNDKCMTLYEPKGLSQIILMRVPRAINRERMVRLITTALGFDNETFIPGDQIVVAVDPSRHSLHRENTLYLRAVEHRRAGFEYIHNVRQLFPIDAAEDNLSKHLHRVN